jgi:hypothetical protein
MYRVVSQSFVNNLDRQPQINMKGLLEDVKRLKTKEETLNISNIENACSSIYTKNGNSIFVGSGCFFTMGDDLFKGYFLTAAHCVLKANSYTKMDELYVTNPINNTWHQIDKNSIYLDGVADIALIQTNIDFTSHSHFCLQLSTVEASAGNTCYVCGNPGGLDTDSISKGVVRDGHHTLRSGSYVPDAIYIDTAGIGGNSGSPILNIHGKIIGLFLFGIVGSETLNGGANLDTLRRSLQVLRIGNDNKPKKLYLGLNWEVPNAFTTQTYYNDPTGFPKQGLRITGIDTVNSPFHPHFQSDDLLLSYVIQNKKTDLGALQHQRTLGQLIYTLQSHPPPESIKFYYIRNAIDGVLEIDIPILNAKSYADVHDTKDLVLIGGGGEDEDLALIGGGG